MIQLGAIAAFFVTIFGTMFGFLATWFTKKIAIQLFIVTVVASLTLAVFVSIEALIDGVSVVVPTEMQQALNMITPDNFWICFSAIMSAKMFRWVWVWKVHFVEMYSNGS